METAQTTTLSGRIEYICFKKKLKQSELASILGVSSTAIYKIASGATLNPSMELLLGIHQKLGINLLWLATGEGQMDDKEKISMDDSVNHDSFGNKVIEQLESRIEELKEQVGNLRYVVALQQQLLESASGIKVGKLEGAIIDGPLSTAAFDAIMNTYRSSFFGRFGNAPLFSAVSVAKLVAPRSL